MLVGESYLKNNKRKVTFIWNIQEPMISNIFFTAVISVSSLFSLGKKWKASSALTSEMIFKTWSIANVNCGSMAHQESQTEEDKPLKERSNVGDKEIIHMVSLLWPQFALHHRFIRKLMTKYWATCFLYLLPMHNILKLPNKFGNGLITLPIHCLECPSDHAHCHFLGQFYPIWHPIPTM